MKKLLFIIMIAMLASPLFFAQTDAGKEVRDGVFIHLTHGYDNPHRVAMALSMATKMASDKDVLVYLDIEAVKIVLKDAEDIKHHSFPSAQESMKKLLDMGVTIFACPGCLKSFGKTGEDLRPGVKVAEKEQFFGFTKGRILTLDY